jgi:hypothetical protein
MAKKPEWRQMLGSLEKIERSAFNIVGWFVVVVLTVVLTLGDIVFHIFRIEDVGLLKIFTYLVLLALWTHATAERTAREKLERQLEAPRAFFLKDRSAVYRAAAELLQKAREHPAATEIVLTSLRVPRWPGGETFPAMERFLEEKMRILREGRIAVRHIFNLPDESSLERLLESEPGMLAKEGKGKAFLVKAFARGDDLPHIDVGAARGIGVVFAFPDPCSGRGTRRACASTIRRSPRWPSGISRPSGRTSAASSSSIGET